MLKPRSPVRSLSCQRWQGFSEAMRRMCNRKAIEWSNSLSGGIAMALAMIGNSKPSCHAYYLDDDKVAAAKQQAMAEAKRDKAVPYITTNDILTSGFFNAVSADVGFMGFDCRGKLEGASEAVAGNYVTALVMDEGA